MEDQLFVFVDCMLMDILKPTDMVVKQLQSSNKNLVSVLELVNEVSEQKAVK